METSRYARCPKGVDRALPECQPYCHPEEAKATKILGREKRSHQERTRQTTRNWIHQRSLPPRVVTNPVLVLKRNNNEWRMCIDYTDLNKHCPKDPFGLPRIDQVIDSMAGCVLLSFLDCYSGYHQIALKEEDQIKTAFITPFGAYAYKTMSFGLRNAGATYQRAIQLCFTNQLHRNVEAYVDDVVMKTKEFDSFIPDLEETFNSL